MKADACGMQDTLADILVAPALVTLATRHRVRAAGRDGAAG